MKYNETSNFYSIVNCPFTNNHTHNSLFKSPSILYFGLPYLDKTWLGCECGGGTSRHKRKPIKRVPGKDDRVKRSFFTLLTTYKLTSFRLKINGQISVTFLHISWKLIIFHKAIISIHYFSLFSNLIRHNPLFIFILHYCI